MKNTLSLLKINCLFLFLLITYSCNDDHINIEEGIVESVDNDSLKSNSGQDELDINFINFYNKNYVTDGYQLGFRSQLNVDDVINKVYTTTLSTFVINTLDFYGIPCWECATISTNKIDDYILVPVINTTTNIVSEVLFVPTGSSNRDMVKVDRISLKSYLFDPYQDIISDFDKLFSSKAWDYSKSNQNIYKTRLKTLKCGEDCPNGYEEDKCGHPREDCGDDNVSENPGDWTATFNLYIHNIFNRDDSNDDTIKPFGGDGSGTGGPSGTGIEDSEFYGITLDDLLDAIDEIKECTNSAEDVSNLLSQLNDLFPQVNFNENVEYTFNSLQGHIGNQNPSASLDEIAQQTANSVLSMSISAALAGQDADTQTEVMEALKRAGCDGSGNDDEVEVDKECKGVMAPEAKAALDAIDDMVFPCSDLDAEAIKNNIKSELCSKAKEDGDNVSAEDVEEALEPYEGIIIDESFRNCANLMCILNHMIEQGGPTFCDNTDENFISNPLASLHLSATSNVGPHLNYFESRGAEAATWPDGDGNNVHIVINPVNCDGTRSTQDFIADIVHEAIHARMFNDCWPEGISYYDYKAGFLECVEIYYHVNTDNITEETHHNIMADRFIVDIAKGIAAYYGSTNWEDFEYLAWHGLKQYPEYANEEWFKLELENAEKRYDEISPTLTDPCAN